MPVAAMKRPDPTEHAPYYGRYVDLVPQGDICALLEQQIGDTRKLVGGLDEARAAHRYAPGKWSIKQVVGHLSDTERIMACRALRFSRSDATPVPGFDENTYSEHAASDERSLKDLLAEFGAVRAATVALFRGMNEGMTACRGVANNHEVSVRALAHIIAGHERHHVAILKERYGVK